MRAFRVPQHCRAYQYTSRIRDQRFIVHFSQERAAVLGLHPPSMWSRPFFIRTWWFIGAASISLSLSRLLRWKKIKITFPFFHPSKKKTPTKRILHCRPLWLHSLDQVGNFKGLCLCVLGRFTQVCQFMSVCWPWSVKDFMLSLERLLFVYMKSL